MAITKDSIGKMVLPNIDGIPDSMRNKNKWLLWRLEEKQGSNELMKVPCDKHGNRITGFKANGNFHDVVNAYINSTDFAGIGFNLEGSGFVCVDLDADDLDKMDAQFVRWGKDTYTEISPSGGGLHLFYEAQCPQPKEGHEIGVKNKAFKGGELYHEDRFMTVTGVTWEKTGQSEPASGLVAASAIKEVIERFHLEKPIQAAPTVTGGTCEFTKEQVLEIMFNAPNKGEKIRDMYENGYSSRFASPDEQSEADLSFAREIAYFCQGDAALMQEVIADTEFGKRPKWISKRGSSTYGAGRIQKAINGLDDIYTPAVQLPEIIPSDWDEQLMTQIQLAGGKDVDSQTLAFVLIETDVAFKGLFGYDEFLEEIVLMKDPAPELGLAWNYKQGTSINLEKDKMFMAKMSRFFSNNYKSVRKEHIAEAIRSVAGNNRFDALTTMYTCDVDGTPLTWKEGDHDYLGEFAIDVMGCLDIPLNREMWKRQVMNVVERGISGKYEPVIYKNIMILMGEQSSGKSLVPKILGGRFYGDDLSRYSLDNARVGNILKRNSVLEFGELGFLKKVDIEQLKSFLTMTTWKSNLFGNGEDTQFDLRCSFMITVNFDNFINDPSGAERFFPLTIGVNRKPKENGAILYNYYKNRQHDARMMFAQARYYLEQEKKLGLNPLDVPQEYEAMMEQARQGIIKRDDDVEDVIETYVEADFPVDTFHAFDPQFKELRHKWDWTIIEKNESWTVADYEKEMRALAQPDPDFETRDLTALENGVLVTQKVQKVSVKYLIELLNLDQETNDMKFLTKKVTDSLRRLGFKKYKDKNGLPARGKDHFQKTRGKNDLWVRDGYMDALPRFKS